MLVVNVHHHNAVSKQCCKEDFSLIIDFSIWPLIGIVSVIITFLYVCLLTDWMSVFFVPNWFFVVLVFVHVVVLIPLITLLCLSFLLFQCL